MNEKNHWNKIAPSYEEEIFDVFRSDKNKRLAGCFRRYANSKHRAIDFGCGIGKAFRFLAPVFKEVLAVDISDECLTQARLNSFTNITYRQADLAKKKVNLPLSEFVFCCNVIMLPEPEKNVLMIRNVFKALNKGGTAVIVVPSMESYLFSVWRLFDWYKKEGVKPDKISPDEWSGFRGSKPDILQGILQINGVRTKHYLQPEIELLFSQAGFNDLHVRRIEYEWNTEFSAPPKWMKAPYPWDWLVECRKR